MLVVVSNKVHGEQEQAWYAPHALLVDPVALLMSVPLDERAFGCSAAQIAIL